MFLKLKLSCLVFGFYSLLFINWRFLNVPDRFFYMNKILNNIIIHNIVILNILFIKENRSHTYAIIIKKIGPVIFNIDICVT